MIKRERDAWLAKSDCPILTTVQAMETAAQLDNRLRKIQIDATKTYLFLKIGCVNKPLAEFFSSATLTSLDLNYSMMLSGKARSFLLDHPASRALLIFALQKEDSLHDEKAGKLWDGTIPCPSKPLRIRTRNICDDEAEFSC